MSTIKIVSSTIPLHDEQRWRCLICNRELAYSQPISLELAALLVGTFTDYHENHCGRLAEREEQVSEAR